MPETETPQQTTPQALKATFADIESTPTPESDEPEVVEQAEGTDDTDPDAPEVDEKPKPSTGLSAEDIGKLAEALRPIATPTEKPKEYTEAEVREIFKVYEPDVDTVTKLLSGGEDSLVALKEILAGHTTHLTTVFKYKLEHDLGALRAQMEPVSKAAQVAAQEREEKQFFTENPDLTERRDVVELVLAKLSTSGVRPKTPAEARKLLAGETRAVLKKLGVSVSDDESTDTTETTTTPSRRMTTLSSGNGGGAGGAGRLAANGSTKQVLKDIFG